MTGTWNLEVSIDQSSILNHQGWTSDKLPSTFINVGLLGLFFCILGWPSDSRLLAPCKLHWEGYIRHNNNTVAWPATLARVLYDIQMPREPP